MWSRNSFQVLFRFVSLLLTVFFSSVAPNATLLMLLVPVAPSSTTSSAATAAKRVDDRKKAGEKNIHRFQEIIIKLNCCSNKHADEIAFIRSSAGDERVSRFLLQSFSLFSPSLSKVSVSKSSLCSLIRFFTQPEAHFSSCIEEKSWRKSVTSSRELIDSKTFKQSRLRN